TLAVADAEQVERVFQERLLSVTSEVTASSLPLSWRPSGKKRRRRRSVVDKTVLALPAPRRIRDRDHVKSVAKQSCLSVPAVLPMSTTYALHSHRRWAARSATSSRFRCAADITVRSIAAVTKLRGGTRLALMRPPLLACFG